MYCTSTSNENMLEFIFYSNFGKINIGILDVTIRLTVFRNYFLFDKLPVLYFVKRGTVSVLTCTSPIIDNSDNNWCYFR